MRAHLHRLEAFVVWSLVGLLAISLIGIFLR